jgi:tetratricopeptide (TPR) repeat protein
MKNCSKQLGYLTLLLTTAALTSTMALAQGMPSPQQQPMGQQQPGQPPGQQPPNPASRQAAPLESTPPPVSAEEDAAIKEFRDATPQDGAKKDQLAEQFVQKYPNSRYAPEAYSWLVRAYYRKGEVDKMEAAAEKQLAVYPNDPQTLALVGSTLPRAMNASTPDPQKRLDKADKYCHKALELLPTIPKPENMTDETFQQLKGQTSALAYSGLGLVAFRRGNYGEAIPELENAVKADSQPDPVNYFVLGVANEKTSHFQDAVAAFTKCAAIPGGMQATCSQNVEEAKKLSATQLSAPK